MDGMISPDKKNLAKNNLNISEKSPVLKKQVEMRERFAKLISKDLSPQPAIIEFRDDNGKEWPLAFRKSITSITGKKGTHKSRLMETCLAIMLADTEYAGIFRSADIKEAPFIIWVDTERDQEYQFPEALQKVFAAAGNKYKIPDNVELVSLTTEPRENRFEYVKEVVSDAWKNNMNQAIVLAIDVSTDMIINFNDPAESLKAIDYLIDLINTYDVTIMVVIHQNPGKGDSKQGGGRGHFGTELGNKSTTEISVSYEKDTKVITAEITKGRKIPPGMNFKFKYDQMNDMIEPLSDAQKQIVIAASPIDELLTILPFLFGKKISRPRKDVIKEIIEQNGGSEPNHRKNIDKIIAGELPLMFQLEDENKFKLMERNTHKGIVFLNLYDATAKI